MTLAVMALYADGTHAADATSRSWRVKETDRIAAMAAELRKLGATVRRRGRLHRSRRRRRAWRRAAHRTPTTTTAWRCACRWPPSTRWPAATCRCASSTRAAWPRPSRTTSRRCSTVVHADASDIPVITVDGPTASGKGTLAAAVAARLGWHQLDSGALYRATAWRRCSDGVARRRRRCAGPAGRHARRCASTAAASGSTATKSRERCARKPSARMASRVSALPAVREALHGAAAVVSPRARPGGRRSRHGHRGVPRRAAQGVPDRQRRHACRAAA